MKPFAGFKSEANAGGSKYMLPAGPYVAKIINVKIDGDEPDAPQEKEVKACNINTKK